MTPDTEEQPTLAPPLVQWRAATRPYGGEDVSGDLEVVACYPGGARGGGGIAAAAW
jgi:hypothetical protein